MRPIGSVNSMHALQRTPRDRRTTVREITPGNLAGRLGMWLRADTLGLADGTAISAWSDWAGNGNNGSAAGVNQPTARLTTNGINGQPVANLSAAGTDYLTLVDGVTIHPATLTLGAIFRQNGSTQYSHLFSRWYGATWANPYVSYSISLNDDAAHTPEFAVTIAGVRKPLIATGYTYPSGVHMLIGVYDGAYMKFYGDGKLIGVSAQTGVIDYTNPTTNNFLGRAASTGSYYINLDLPECFIAAAITDQERRGIELGWARRYGVQLAG